MFAMCLLCCFVSFGFGVTFWVALVLVFATSFAFWVFPVVLKMLLCFRLILDGFVTSCVVWVL